MSTDDMLLGPCSMCQSVPYWSDTQAQALARSYHRRLEEAQQEVLTLELALVAAREQIREQSEIIARQNDKLRQPAEIPCSFTSAPRRTS